VRTKEKTESSGV